MISSQPAAATPPVLPSPPQTLAGGAGAGAKHPIRPIELQQALNDYAFAPARRGSAGPAKRDSAAPARGATTSLPLDTSDGRAFLQSRISLLGRTGFVLIATFLTLGLLVLLALDVPGQRVPGVALQLVGMGITGAIWRVTKRRTLSMRMLLALDVGGSVAICAVFTAMGAAIPSYARPELYVMVCVTQILALRAVFVPSPAGRTASIGAAAAAGMVAFTLWFYSTHRAPAGAPGRVTYAAIALLLGGASVVVTTLISRTLFGLRLRVREATQLGQYTLDKKLGEGGMGVVYKARHAMLTRPTAVKLLHPGRTDERDIVRFEREVQLTSMLTHPNTIAIYDFGRTPEGVFYYAMEYLEGIDLEVLIEHEGPQPASRVIHILTQVCGALDEAHRAGLIHRDIKPANIILCERGGVPDVAKVVDFGLVKSIAGFDAGAPAINESAVEALTGTPLYMSPESLTAPTTIGAQSDIYALGAVGYYLLTGTHAFWRRTLIDVCVAHVHDPPVHPAERLGRAVPDDLAEALLACLAKDPAERPQGAAALGATLARCRDAQAWDGARWREWWKTRGRDIRESGRSLPTQATVAAPVRPRLLTVDVRARNAAARAA